MMRLTERAPHLWDDSIQTEVSNHNDCFYSTGELGTNGINIPSTWGGSPVTNCTGL